MIQTQYNKSIRNLTSSKKTAQKNILNVRVLPHRWLSNSECSIQTHTGTFLPNRENLMTACLPSFSWNTSGFGIWGKCCKNANFRQFPTEKWWEDQSEFLERLDQEMIVKNISNMRLYHQFHICSYVSAEWATSCMRKNPTQQTVLMLEGCIYCLQLGRDWASAGEGHHKTSESCGGRTEWGGNTNKTCHWFQLVLLEFKH